MKLVLVLLCTFVFGLASGIALSSPVSPSGTSPDVVGHQLHRSESSKDKVRSVHPSIFSRLKRLEHQLKILTSQVQSHHSQRDDGQSSARPPAGPTEQPEGAKDVTSIFQDEIQSEGSEVRQAVGQIVRDEFQNMRSEWSAFRDARHEVRDEALLQAFAMTANLEPDERSTLAGLLTSERNEVGALRRKARETFDVKAGRESTRSRRLETDQAIKDLLGAERSESWQRLRESRRPPWRR
jgi:hypothetical protein